MEMKKIFKVGAVIVSGRKFMVVREKGVKGYIMPGGRPEKGETKEDTLKRELKEELNADVKSFSSIGTMEGPSLKKDTWVVQDVFLTEITGDIKPQSEIADMAWVDSSDEKQNKNIMLSPFIRKVLIPKLLEMNLIE